MSRSLKKGPFCDEHLMKKVEALNAANKKEVIKTVCEAVNQLYESLTGEEKLSKTIENSKQILNDKGIKINELELRMYIESVIGCFKKETMTKQ